MTILDAIKDPQLFGPVFQGASWTAWTAFLAYVFGLPMDDEQAALARRCTGRETVPLIPCSEAVVIVGRRGGKSFVMALIGVYVACFRTYKFPPGGWGVVVLIASDRRQSRVLKRYVSGLLQAVPMLQAMVTNETADAIELDNGLTIEIHTASFRAVRGYTIVAAICDEIAFWPTDASANPDTEILTALRPAMATIPNALLLLISTPYARKGELWKAYRDHYRKEHDPVLVWQSDTRTMNPTVPQVVIDQAYQQDEASASAEFGAQFRKDVETFIARDVVEACVVSGRHELPPLTTVSYQAFVDPSGGSQDSMTVAIAHREGERVVLDCVREVRPPFSPEQVVADFAALLKRYRVLTVVGDRYGGEWCREPFRKLGLWYQVAEKTRSDLYRDLLPLLNSKTIELLDHARLVTQLCSLERRTARGGKDSIDHAPHSHDDICNSLAGVADLAHGGARVPGIYILDAPQFSDAHLFQRMM